MHGLHVHHQPIKFNTLAHGLLSWAARNFLTLTRRVLRC
ncbi:hypothetical protein PDR5_15990 [Pseudomonas sp. DR 5-09]|nr:hypothetical protein PDR5_15990 [Pseudomonas sp. DR 5-09]